MHVCCNSGVFVNDFGADVRGCCDSVDGDGGMFEVIPMNVIGCFFLRARRTFARYLTFYSCEEEFTVVPLDNSLRT